MKTFHFVIASLTIMVILLINCGLVEKISNRNPIIRGVYANPARISISDSTVLNVEAEDPDGDQLYYSWSSYGKGNFSPSHIGQSVSWKPPQYSGMFKLTVTVIDENGGETTGDVIVTVIGQEIPVVTITAPEEGEFIPGIGTYTIRATVDHPLDISKVEFSVDRDSLLAPVVYSGSFYECPWHLDGVSGPKTIIAKAYGAGSATNPGVDSVHVTIEGVTQIPLR